MLTLKGGKPPLGLGKKKEEEDSDGPAKREITDEERRKRARENWAKLRNHIKQMRHTVNFLVQTLDEVNERQKDAIGMSEDAAGDDSDSKPVRESQGGRRTCLNKLMIHPMQSSWLGTWRVAINMLFFVGYVYDPYHLAFYLTDGHKRT